MGKNIYTKRQIWLVGIGVILLTLFCVFSSSQAHAEETNTLSIYPAIIEKTLDPGSDSSQSITVYNKEEKAIGIRAYAQNFSASDEFGGMIFNNDTEKEFSASEWLEIKNTNMVIAPKSKFDFLFTINIPKDAEPGGHYVTIFFEFVNPLESSSGSKVSVSQRVGALVFITVSGQIEEKGHVLGSNSNDKCLGVQCSFKTAKLREWGPVPFEFRFENTGNVHVKVKSKIEIYNIFGMKVGEALVEEKTVLPNSTRFFDAKWLREPLFGRYTAKLTLNYGTLNVTERAQTSFWAIPWKGILFVFILVIFIIIYKLKKRKRSSANKNGIQ